MPTLVAEDNRLKAAIFRQTVRDIDLKIAAIHAEQRLFRRYKFGSDFHEIQLNALDAERSDLVRQLGSMQSKGSYPRQQSGGIRSWLLLPIAFGALALQAVQPKRRRSRLRAAFSAPLVLEPSGRQSVFRS